MSAPLLSVPSNLQPSFWLNPYSQKRSSRRSRRSNLGDVGQRESPNSASASSAGDLISESVLLGVLLESMPIGVLVLTASLKPIYCNEKASNLCDRLKDSDIDALPSIVCELCNRLMSESPALPEPLIVEYQGQTDQFFRLQVRWINLSTAQPLLLVLLEDCHESMREELAIEQEKYDLTDRESEIWFLLRQKYSYQDISALLKISMNTVKTHVKNIYAKRKNLAGERKIWYSR